MKTWPVKKTYLKVLFMLKSECQEKQEEVGRMQGVGVGVGGLGVRGGSVKPTAECFSREDVTCSSWLRLDRFV